MRRASSAAAAASPSGCTTAPAVAPNAMRAPLTLPPLAPLATARTVRARAGAASSAGVSGAPGRPCTGIPRAAQMRTPAASTSALVSSAAARDRPMKRWLRSVTWPFGAIWTFSARRSPWATPALCRSSSPVSTHQPVAAATAGGSGPERSRVARELPSSGSVTAQASFSWTAHPRTDCRVGSGRPARRRSLSPASRASSAVFMTACTTTAGRPSCSARQRRIRPGGSAGATRVADSPLQLSTATTA